MINKNKYKPFILLGIISISLIIISSGYANTPLITNEEIAARTKNPTKAKTIIKQMENNIDKKYSK